MRILFILLIISNISYSQKWSNTGAKWRYLYQSGMLTTGYVDIEYNKDTMISNFQCKKLDKKFVTKSYLTYTVDSFIDNPIFTFERNDSIFFYLEQTQSFEVFYIFGLNIGDTFYLRNPYQSPVNDSLVKHLVLDTSSVLINNIRIRKYSAEVILNNNSSGLPPPIQTVYDFFGNMSYIIPNFEIQIDGDGYTLACYEDSIFSRFNIYSYMDCDKLITDLTKTEEFNSIGIYPNPTKSSFQINTETGYHYLIYDLYGRHVDEGKIENNNPISTNNLKSGIYYIRFEETIGTNRNEKSNFLRKLIVN